MSCFWNPLLSLIAKFKVPELFGELFLEQVLYEYQNVHIESQYVLVMFLKYSDVCVNMSIISKFAKVHQLLLPKVNWLPIQSRITLIRLRDVIAFGIYGLYKSFIQITRQVKFSTFLQTLWLSFNYPTYDIMFMKNPIQYQCLYVYICYII